MHNPLIWQEDGMWAKTTYQRSSLHSENIFRPNLSQEDVELNTKLSNNEEILANL